MKTKIIICIVLFATALFAPLCEHYNEPSVPNWSEGYGLRGDKFAQALKSETLEDQTFVDLATTKSSTRRAMFLDNPETEEVFGGIRGTKDYEKPYVTMKKSLEKAIAQYSVDKNIPISEARKQFITKELYRDFIISSKYANCGDCSLIMSARMHAKYPELNVETISNNVHVFTVVNRQLGTDLQAPLTWNEDTIIVDGWIQKVYTKQEFMGGFPEPSIPTSAHYPPYTKLLEYHNGTLFTYFDEV